MDRTIQMIQSFCSAGLERTMSGLMIKKATVEPGLTTS